MTETSTKIRVGRQTIEVIAGHTIRHKFGRIRLTARRDATGGWDATFSLGYKLRGRGYAPDLQTAVSLAHKSFRQDAQRSRAAARRRPRTIESDRTKDMEAALRKDARYAKSIQVAEKQVAVVERRTAYALEAVR